MNVEHDLYFISDPGHGWLSVPISLVEELNISEQITSYSFWDSRSHRVFLEEDVDAGIFLEAAKKANLNVKFKEVYVEDFQDWMIDGACESKLTI